MSNSKDPAAIPCSAEYTELEISELLARDRRIIFEKCQARTLVIIIILPRPAGTGKPMRRSNGRKVYIDMSIEGLGVYVSELVCFIPWRLPKQENSVCVPPAGKVHVHILRAHQRVGP